MDELSKLLKEARPLYRRRKTRKTIAKLILVMTMPMFIMTGICQTYLQGNDIYLSLDKNVLQYELMEDEFGLLGLKH